MKISIASCKSTKETKFFSRKIKELAGKYGRTRRVRRDGNCFYRAYAFGCLDYIARNRDQIPVFLSTIENSFKFLTDLGDPEFPLSDFWEALVDEIKWVDTDSPTGQEVINHMNDQGTADYLTYYMRAITSGQLRADIAEFAPFLPIGETMVDFIRKEVSPMGRESDYLQSVALSRALKIGVQIEYLDQSSGPLNSHTLPEGATPHVFLLYRPGHYDILLDPTEA